jgi:hypothetical protein
MKYLKKYMIFESDGHDGWQVEFDYMNKAQKEEMYQECLDILKEVEDNGYTVSVINDIFSEDPSISFFIKKTGIMHSDDFWSGIKETYERLKEYLSEYGFYTENFYKYKKLERPRIGVIHEEDPLTGIATPKRDVQITFCLK